MGGGITLLSKVIPKIYTKVLNDVMEFPDKEWRTRITSGELLWRLLFGTINTNKQTEAVSGVWAAVQRIIWRGVPIFSGDSIVDIIGQNLSKRFFFRNLDDPSTIEEIAIFKRALSIHNTIGVYPLNDGRFRYPLIKAANLHLMPCPWHLKMGCPNGQEEVTILADFYLNHLKLPENWRIRIERSLVGIHDGKKFTAQLQISSNCIQFTRHCLNCGKLYNSTLHAFVDCPKVGILKRLVMLNIKGTDQGEEKYVKALVLFGFSNRNKVRDPNMKAIDAALLNAKARIAQCLTSAEPLRPGDLYGVILHAAARYTALTLKIPTASDDSWTQASKIIKYYPTSSVNYFNLTKRIIKFLK